MTATNATKTALAVDIASVRWNLTSTRKNSDERFWDLLDRPNSADNLFALLNQS